MIGQVLGRRGMRQFGDKSHIRAVVNNAYVAYELETMFSDDLVSIRR